MKAKYIILSVVAATLSLTSCVDNLNTKPLDPREVTADVAYDTPESYVQGLAKVYGALALTGQSGAGSGEIDGADPGASQFIRALWYLQEFPTDETKNAWPDQEVPELNYITWSASPNKAISGMYYRLTFSVSIVNEYLRQTSPEKLSTRKVSEALKEEIQQYRTEARFIRALVWSYAIDLFGNMPFFTENDPIGKYFPDQISRKDLFAYVEKELLEIEPLMAAPRTQVFGRADKAAVWTVLSRLYLNSEVYTGTAKYSECITYSKKVVDAGYGLTPNYSHLFMADNDYTNPNTFKEMIFTVNFDGAHTQSYGATTFLCVGSRSGSDSSTPESGMNGGWDGNRALSTLVDLFPNNDKTDANGYLISEDKRAIIYTKDRLKNGPAVEKAFKDGYSVYKFRNVKSTGGMGKNQGFADTDFPLMRLPEHYLNIAEAVARGGQGATKAEAIGYINKLRERAYGNQSGNITDYTLQFVLDERGRELYWEGFRRTDLIRYGLFTSGVYLWPWKGGSNTGRGVDAKFNLYPIPAADITANPKLKQNPGY
ncbi:SusD [Mucinivorans hirudinis]|uniref:SusD n=1 Tax=Mucinivorans hirudinis TaxID=1433126 RepID=A0A060RDU8_9BACT|nr:SusD [Mucinivorans hirudinis]